MNKLSLVFENLLVAWYQTREAFVEGGVKNVLRQRFFWKRKATPVEMELRVVAPSPARFLRDYNYAFVEIREEYLRDGMLYFLPGSRSIKASRNLKKGWRGFALTMHGQVVGDVWCVTPPMEDTLIQHADLEMLGITPRAGEAYAFDMYILPEHRGENLAAPFHRSLHDLLRSEGCNKIYGFYWDDNLPALWMHRIMKFKELPKRQVSRFLFFMKAEDVSDIGHSRKTSQGQPVG
ncbi:MAG TPA: hypothetical protein PK078_04140 [Anaerolineales bacterium]|nr:hypothetical protein [Anaerolineales bacterium]HNA88058.1 hypothetical protein [Anaerolineales bacterium]HNB35014.1 hypothetical protein [Anaerolineales bacterium]